MNRIELRPYRLDRQFNLLTAPQPGRRPGILALALLVGVATAVQPLSAATIIWSGTSGTDTNWSNGNNWFGTVAPAGGDDVKLFDTGTNGVTGTPNSLVDGSFAGYIGSLQLGQSNGLHTIAIAPGQTLNITNGNLSVGTPGDVNLARNFTNSIVGAGATLNFNNTNASLVLNQGGTIGGRAGLDLSGLDTFLMSGSRIGLGTTTLPNPGGLNQRLAGQLFLAKTNVIRLATAAPLNSYQTISALTPAIEMSHNAGNNAGIQSFIYLGISNVFYVDSISAARTKASANSAATILFNPAFIASSPVAYFRGINGDSSRVTWWSIGDMANSASSAQVSIGTNNFTGGTVDALIETLSLGRDCAPQHTATIANVGVLTFNAGKIDANTVLVGNQSLNTTVNSAAPNFGFINVNGSALLIVNSNLVLGNTLFNGGAAFKTAGTLNINGGTVRARTIAIGPFSTTNTVTLNSGTLVLTNTMGSPASGVRVFNVTNSTLQLFVAPNTTNICVTNLNLGGATNIISLGSVAVFSSYPKQSQLIAYAGTLNGTYNFGFGATTLPDTAPGAYLSNNVTTKSIDLVVPNDPRPVLLTQPSSYSGDPGDNITTNFTVTVSPFSVTPLSYQWYLDGNPLADGTSGAGSQYTGSTTDTLLITNAQTADNGFLTVVVSNVYGSTTSSPPAALSVGHIPPTVTGLTDQTVVQGNNLTLTASVGGAPLPFKQWQVSPDGGTTTTNIPGANGSSLSLLNVQYAQNGYIYSLIASNSEGVATGSMTLTVIIAPTISQQPTNLTVVEGSSATFSVTASGIPALSYQWRKNNAPITDETNSSYTILSATASDIASYSVMITNAAGFLLSAQATLTVNSTMTVASLSPANAGTGICYDTPLYLTFSEPVLLRSAGKIRIFNATNTVTPVDTIDLALNSGNGVQSRALFSGDAQGFNYYPVIVSGSTAAIYPHSSTVMTSNSTYFVTVENGVFSDTGSNYFAGITDTNAWRFTTKPGGPANPTNLIVNADGTGDFVTVQGAVDFIPAGSTTPRLINIRNGDYFEIVNISAKHNVTFRGQNRDATVVGYPNNANIAPGGTTHARMAFKIGGNDIAIENLTVTNRTPVGGSQAEAVMVESNARRFIFNNATMTSFQDTFLANVNSSQMYAYNSKVLGQFDYLWGGGNCFLTNCEIKTLLGAGGSGSGNLVATRTDATGSGNWPGFLGLSASNGFSFVGCQFTRVAGVTNITLAGSNGTTNGVAAWINCSFDTNCYRAPQVAAANSELLWEFGNSNLDNTVATPPYAGVVQLTVGDPRLVAAQNSVLWLNGWVPQLAPNILTNPVSQSVSGGQSATFTVVATGIPDPSYQWLKNGTNLLGESAATLTINSANANDAGTYSVIVSNIAGSVTSSTATLTVGNTAPTLAPVSDQTVNVGVTVTITNVVTDPDVPAQTLTFSLLTGPTNATLGAASGIFTFRPLVSQADTTNLFSVSVTDNGAPNFSATNSFSVIVNPIALPEITAPTSSGGQFSLTVSGQSGPDYAVQATDDLLSGIWVTLFSTNSASMPFTFVDTNSAPKQFYRVIVGPPLP